ncbi:DUF1576 domain-containing protein [Alkalibacter mobilis]|uniref:DUF1576 domain-containing protein n=1 Tax=Alkalibacter mobilis TaxID=2787712 RepID=UPI00189CE2FE|nr:DUF1576 domain-containing protein [Alkalibacter mobilis]MBF7097521.1 DUF1576 domain-containing protein [Alkalibacter mobilis]
MQKKNNKIFEIDDTVAVSNLTECKYSTVITKIAEEKNHLYNDFKYQIITLITIFLFASAFIFNTPSEIVEGMKAILVSPSTLVTDYFLISNIGSALFNSAVITFVGIFLARVNKVEMNGALMAALFTLAGFSFFGKNLYNTWGVLAGVYLYSKFRNEAFNRYLIMGLFSTALGPLISCITFGLNLNIYLGFIIGNLAGVIAGFVIPPLSCHFLIFHKGFSLYNIGFTAGIVGMFFMAVLRGLGYEIESTVRVITGMNRPLGIFLSMLFLLLLLTGIVQSRFKIKEIKLLLKKTGKLPTDFMSDTSIGIILINMSLLGFMSMAYVILLGGNFNGPVIGGIFTVVGFGAYGKHIKNVVPIFIGVYLASIFNVYDAGSTSALLAALFGTTLAPVAGHFGPLYGIIAGFFHMSMTMNVSYLHGGMNLYNNGFSGGFVAAALVPLFNALRK